jgi:hypothetical protein
VSAILDPRILCSWDDVGHIIDGSAAATGGGPVGAVEHLKTLCCLGLPPESAMIAVTPLLHEIIPHGWTRIALLEGDATIRSGYSENPAAMVILRDRMWRFMDDPSSPANWLP